MFFASKFQWRKGVKHLFFIENHQKSLFFMNDYQCWFLLVSFLFRVFLSFFNTEFNRKDVQTNFWKPWKVTKELFWSPHTHRENEAFFQKNTLFVHKCSISNRPCPSIFSMCMTTSKQLFCHFFKVSKKFVWTSLLLNSVLKKDKKTRNKKETRRNQHW